MGGPSVLYRCLTHGKGWTGPSSEACEFGWDSDFDEVGVGAGVMQTVYSASICLVEYSVVAQLLGLSLRGGIQRAVVLAVTATSQI